MDNKLKNAFSFLTYAIVLLCVAVVICDIAIADLELHRANGVSRHDSYLVSETFKVLVAPILLTGIAAAASALAAIMNVIDYLTNKK